MGVCKYEQAQADKHRCMHVWENDFSDRAKAVFLMAATGARQNYNSAQSGPESSRDRADRGRQGQSYFSLSCQPSRQTGRLGRWQLWQAESRSPLGERGMSVGATGGRMLGKQSLAGHKRQGQTCFSCRGHSGCSNEGGGGGSPHYGSPARELFQSSSLVAM